MSGYYVSWQMSDGQHDRISTDSRSKAWEVYQAWRRKVPATSYGAKCWTFWNYSAGESQTSEEFLRYASSSRYEWTTEGWKADYS